MEKRNLIHELESATAYGQITGRYEARFLFESEAQAYAKSLTVPETWRVVIAESYLNAAIETWTNL